MTKESAFSSSSGEAKQDKNLIISVVTIALIVGGIFYYQKNYRQNLVPETPEETITTPALS